MNKYQKAQEWIAEQKKPIKMPQVIAFADKDIELETILRCLLDSSQISTFEKKMEKHELSHLNMYDAVENYFGTKLLYVFAPKNLWLADLLFTKYKEINASKEIIEEATDELDPSDYLREILKYNVFSSHISFSMSAVINANSVVDYLSEINEHVLGMKNISSSDYSQAKIDQFDLVSYTRFKAKSAMQDYLSNLSELLEKYSVISNKDDLEAAKDLFFKIVPRNISLTGTYAIIPEQGDITYSLEKHPWDNLESYIKRFSDEKEEKKWKKYKLVGKAIIFMFNVGSLPDIVKDLKDMNDYVGVANDSVELLTDGKGLSNEAVIEMIDENLVQLEVRFQNESNGRSFKDFFIDQIRTTIEEGLRKDHKFQINLNHQVLEKIYSQFFLQKIKPLADLKLNANEVAREQIQEVEDKDAFMLNMANFSHREGFVDHDGDDLTFI